MNLMSLIEFLMFIVEPVSIIGQVASSLFFELGGVLGC